LIIRLSTG